MDAPVSANGAVTDPFMLGVEITGEIIIFLYCFLGLAMICDSFLILSLETMCVRWKLREDVAGATLMALGSAAPEIIVNALSTYNAQTDVESTNLGVGAIMGSGCIAFTLIPGCCAFFSPDEFLELKRRPLLRDILTYAVALGMLCYFTLDADISLFESTLLLLLYFVYLLVVIFAPMVRRYYRKYVLKKMVNRQVSFVEERETIEHERRSLNASRSLRTNDSINSSLLSNNSSSAGTESDSLIRNSADRGRYLLDNINQSDNVAQEDEEDEELNRSPLFEDMAEGYYRPSIESIESIVLTERNTLSTLLWYIELPLKLCFKFTCPPCERDSRWERFYPITFLVSFLWVATFSYILSIIVHHWGDLSKLPLALFGFALISSGAEIPDMIQSVTVAKRGYGSMAVSNAIGSQILNICIGLGLPWTLSSLSGNTVEVTQHDMIYAAAVLQAFNVSVVFIMLLGMSLLYRQKKAELTRFKGGVFLFTFALVFTSFIIYSILPLQFR